MGIIGAITVLFFFLLLFFAGFILQHHLIGSQSLCSIVIFSYACGLSYIILICPLLHHFWEISLLSVSCSVLPLSLLLLKKNPHSLILPGRWELFCIGGILLFGFLIRSYTLTDPLPQGQDTWRHLSFISAIYETHHLPQTVPWAVPPRPITIVMYPPGAHCIGALLSQAVGTISFPVITSFFILTATGSALSSFVIFQELFNTKSALLSSLLIVSFLPHMVMSSEITAQSLSIFLFPLIPYLFYRKKYPACILLTSAIFLIHHFSALSCVLTLFCIACGLTLYTKKVTTVAAFFLICGGALLLTSPWWSQVSLLMGNTGLQSTASVPVTQTLSLDPYTSMVSPLLVLLSMAGGFIFLKKRNNVHVFILAWVLILFLATQPVFPVKFHEHRFLAFFIIPCSILASSGLLYIYKRIHPAFFVVLLLLLCIQVPPQFWPSTGEENLAACEWMEDTTLDAVVHVYGPHYTYVYPLSHRKIYEITDFDNPFSSSYASTYFYDDAAWVPHDIQRFGTYDNIYSCSTVTIHRID